MLHQLEIQVNLTWTSQNQLTVKKQGVRGKTNLILFNSFDSNFVNAWELPDTCTDKGEKEVQEYLACKRIPKGQDEEANTQHNTYIRESVYVHTSSAGSSFVDTLEGAPSGTLTQLRKPASSIESLSISPSTYMQ